MRRSRLVPLTCVFASILCAAAARSQTALEFAPPITTSLLPPNPHAAEPGLLFYLSGDHGFNADYRPSYRQGPAEDGWKKMLEWFKRYGVA